MSSLHDDNTNLTVSEFADEYLCHSPADENGPETNYYDYHDNYENYDGYDEAEMVVYDERGEDDQAGYDD